MKLINETQKTTLIENLEIAKTFVTRNRGLLGRHELSENSALWIWHCNAIHTFFMKFAIDAVFIDRNMVVRKLKNNVKPGRIVLPVLRASSVIECQAGFIKRHGLNLGDKLHVDHSIS